MNGLTFLTPRQCCDLSSGYLVTVNLQHLYEARRNPALRDAIFENPLARLCVDGRGARILLQRLLGNSPPLAVGNEVLKARLDAARAQKVWVIGSSADSLARVAAKWTTTSFTQNASRIPALNTSNAGSVAGELLAQNPEGYDLIVVALGVPKQELLASAIAERCPQTPIYCIGGSLEMLGGIHRRAPRIIQSLGLEGVWRLVIQPRRDRLARLIYSYAYFAWFMARPSQLRALIQSAP